MSGLSPASKAVTAALVCGAITAFDLFAALTYSDAWRWALLAFMIVPTVICLINVAKT